MGYLFRLNSLFEWEISSYPSTPAIPQKLREKVYSLEYLFFFLSQPGDEILVSQPIQDFFVKYLNFFEKKSGFFCTTINFSNLILREWGKTSVLKGLSMERNQERIQESKTLNSKIKQSEWNDLYFRKKERLYSKDGIWEVPDGFSLNSPYLFKPEWSFSGISQKIFPGEGDLRSFLGKKTKETGFLEPLHKRKLDFSVLVEAGENNFQILSGLRTEINSNHNFVRATLDETILKEKFDFGMYLSGYLQSTGLKYSGPISLDCYINEDGNMEICEINFRYTMGRILYEISKKYSEFTYHTLFFEKWKNCKNIFDFKLLLDFSKSLNREDMIFLVLTPFTVTGNPTQSGVFYLGRKDSQKFIDLEKIISIEMI